MKGCNTGQIIGKITDYVFLSLTETQRYNNKHLLCQKKKSLTVGDIQTDRVNKKNKPLLLIQFKFNHCTHPEPTLISLPHFLIEQASTYSKYLPPPVTIFFVSLNTSGHKYYLQNYAVLVLLCKGILSSCRGT